MDRQSRTFAQTYWGRFLYRKHLPKCTRRVANLVRKAVALREAYLRNLKSARHIFERLPDIQEANNMCAERTRRVILWAGPFPTLSAWTFASSGGALGFLRKAWSGRIRDVVEVGGIYRGGRGPRIPCATPYGVDFLSQRDAFLIRPVPQRVLLPARGLVARPGTIMVGGQGTLGEGEIFGRAAFVSEDGAKWAWTEHLLRIVPKHGVAARLFAFLTTIVGFRLLRTTAVGTKLLSMRPDLLRQLPIPTLSADDGARVDRLINDSVVARMSADEAEAEAIRIIEQEVLPQWLA